MIETAVGLLETRGAWEALAFFEREPDPVQAANNCNAVIMHLYWKRHNLAAVIGLGLPALQRALMQAELDHEKATAIRHAARHFAYNIASFAWIGWDEPGIIIDTTAQAIGLDMARFNLQLIQMYELQPLKLTRGHAMMGYHLLAANDYAAALENFMVSAEQAEAAGAEAERALAQGFASLTGLLATPEDGAAERELERAFAALDGEGGQAFRTQIETAKRVFA